VPPVLNRGPFARTLLVACAAAGALAFLAMPAQASQSATTPCWKSLLNEWLAGPITTIFPIPCYHQAIKHLPLDVREYSNAANDIELALERAIALKEHKAVTATIAGTTTTIQPVAPTPTTTTTTTTKKKTKSPFSSAITKITPGGSGSFPLPLLILGLIAILLVLAGVGGLAWRRYQDRRGTA